MGGWRGGRDREGKGQEPQPPCDEEHSQWGGEEGAWVSELLRPGFESCFCPLPVRPGEERIGRPPGTVTREEIGEAEGRECRGSSWTRGFS